MPLVSGCYSHQHRDLYDPRSLGDLSTAPCAYSASDPVNVIDPSGQCRLWGSASCLTDAWTSAAQCPADVGGLVLGLLAVGPGVCAVFIGPTPVGAIVSTISTSAALGAAGLDDGACVRGDSPACVAAGSGVGGALVGAGGPANRGAIRTGLLAADSAIAAARLGFSSGLSPQIGVGCLHWT